MRSTTPLLAACTALALAACAPPLSEVPGPDFEAAEREAQRRDAALAQAAALAPPVSEAERLAAEARAALGVPAGAPFDPLAAPGPVTPVEIAALDLDRDNPDLSQEQDFEAVSAERGIEADAERMRIAREARVEIAPAPLERPDPEELGPNVFAYALSPQARPVGSAGAYGRGLRASETRAQGACTGFASADRAQEAFLREGGPERDRLGLDPDGDGNACGWDPDRVRNAVGR